MSEPCDNAVLDLCCQLIRCPSVTPDDAGCQALLAERLQACGFTCRPMPASEVTNLWAQRGTEGPLLVFAGHTDVVPTGPLEQWQSNPFEPDIRDGFLYGRGAADMKASIAAMVLANERFFAQHPAQTGRVGFLITSDEEGPAINGTRAVVERLSAEGVKADYCIVGEPSSREHLGDVIRVGRRGSLNGSLKVRGLQGHVAYPDLADNPIHRIAPALAELASTQWDQGNAYFPPTTWQASNISAGTGATNVVPGELTLSFNFRFCTEQTSASLQTRTAAILDRHGLDYRLSWQLSGEPFLTRPGALIEAVCDSINAATGLTTEKSTGGGTSDGRFIAPTGCEVVELGPVNASIHQVNEHVAIADLEPLAEMYLGILERLLLAPDHA